MSIEVVAMLGSAIGGLISFFLGYSVGRWAKSRAFRRSVLERDVQRIVVNPSSDNPRTFVPESENAKLREACAVLLKMAEHHDPEWLHWPEMHNELRKLGVEVD